MDEPTRAALLELAHRARKLAALAEQLTANPPPAERTEYPRQPAGFRELVQPEPVQPWPATSGLEPTVVTESVAGPQGCTHQFSSGKWCALEAEHPGPHTPAFTGGGQ